MNKKDTQPKMAEAAGKTSAVRIRPTLHKRATEVATETNYSLAQIVELCVEDCLESVDTGKPIVPRIAKVVRALRQK